MKNKRRTTSSGFSIIELLAVVGIFMVIAAMAIPNMMSAIADFKLRSNVSNLAAMMQRARMEAVRRNTTVEIRSENVGGATQFYGDGNGSASFSAGEPVFVLPQGMTAPITGQPSGLDTASGITSFLAGQSVRFNARGLPCVVTTGCTSPAGGAGFAYYFRDNRPLGINGWAAVTVSPAGRIRTWFWTGSAWR